jgi:hypothetical protein
MTRDDITLPRATVEQALEALEYGPDVDPIFAGETEDALRAALAQEQARARDNVAFKQLLAQRDALKQTLHDELAGNLRLRALGGARPDEPMLTFLERIIAERDALLEALHIAEAALSDIGDADREPGDDVAWCEARAAEAIPKARAAIKAVEEGE